MRLAIQIFLLISTLFIGGLIYIGYRETNILMFKWALSLKMESIVKYIRVNTISKKTLPSWIIFSLPDGLWLFSCTSLLLLIWGNKINKKNMVWILLIPSFAILSEIAQGLGIIKGTFDFNDIISYIIGFLLAMLFFVNRKEIFRIK